MYSPHECCSFSHPIRVCVFAFLSYDALLFFSRNTLIGTLKPFLALHFFFESFVALAEFDDEVLSQNQNSMA